MFSVYINSIYSLVFNSFLILCIFSLQGPLSDPVKMLILSESMIALVVVFSIFCLTGDL